MERVIAKDRKSKELLKIAGKVATNDANVLIRGESGVGKDLLSRFIHESGPRADGPFVKIDCANLSGELLESELFGYEKGAFTDAAERKRGRFELAAGGSVLIDEVTALEPALQAKILRVIQEKQFERLGGGETIKADVRVICTTNQPIEELVDSGRFRHDLYYRINVISLMVSPLRERPGDILPLSSHYLRRYARHHGRKFEGFTEPAEELLMRYSWPGNIWELRNTIEQAVILGVEPEVDLPDLRIVTKSTIEERVRFAADKMLSMEEVERAYIIEVMKRTGGSIGRTAQILGIHRKTLLEKRRRYAIKDEWFGRRRGRRPKTV